MSPRSVDVASTRAMSGRRAGMVVDLVRKGREEWRVDEGARERVRAGPAFDDQSRVAPRRRIGDSAQLREGAHVGRRARKRAQSARKYSRRR